MRSKKLNSKGVAVIYLAVCIIVLMAFTGLAVDLGYMYVAKGQLQNAADAAALAGAVRLNPFALSSVAFQQYSARSTAVRIAASNYAARSPVSIASDPTSPNGTQLSMPVDSNSNANDIVFGRWTRATGFVLCTLSGGTPVNAIQVRARRAVSSETPANQGKIPLFFAKIFNVYGGTGFGSMGAVAVATAVTELATPGIVICTNTCSGNSISTLNATCPSPSGAPSDGGLPVAFLQLSPTLGPPSPCATAWTAFSPNNAVNLGPNGNVQALINGTVGTVDLCNLPCFTTNQGIGNAWSDFQTAYDAHKDTNGRWNIGVPFVDNTIRPTTNCVGQAPASNGCPPSGAGILETYYPAGFATIRVCGLKTSGPGGERGIWIDQITCSTCSAASPIQGGTAKLVDPRAFP
jgi:Flp pilus assembly protein TadG